MCVPACLASLVLTSDGIQPASSSLKDDFGFAGWWTFSTFIPLQPTGLYVV